MQRKRLVANCATRMSRRTRALVATYHVDHLRVYVLRDHIALGSDVFQHLVKSLRLDLLATKFGASVVEVEQDAALVQLPDKEARTLTWGRLCFPVSRIYDILCVINAPAKAGSRSISTFSVTTKRLLLCFLGGLPTIGIVSLGPARSLFRVVLRGGVAAPPGPAASLPPAAKRCPSPAASGLTTTMGGETAPSPP